MTEKPHGSKPGDSSSSAGMVDKEADDEFSGCDVEAEGKERLKKEEENQSEEHENVPVPGQQQAAPRAELSQTRISNEESTLSTTRSGWPCSTEHSPPLSKACHPHDELTLQTCFWFPDCRAHDGNVQTELPVSEEARRIAQLLTVSWTESSKYAAYAPS